MRARRTAAGERLRSDDRVEVTNTTAVPWRWICKLIITFPNGARGGCTGWFIGPKAVIERRVTASTRRPAAVGHVRSRSYQACGERRGPMDQ